MIEKFGTMIFPEEFCSLILPYIKDVKSVYEVGSLDGEDARRIYAFFPNTPTYVFEALKSNYDLYLKDDPILTTFNLAISDKDGTAIFYEKEQNGIHSLHNRGDEFKGREYTVEVRRLDTFIEERDLVPPEIMKIDVEGATIEVLIGLGKYLKGVKALHIETEDFPYFDGEVLHEEVGTFLKDNGFTCLQVNKAKVDERGHQYDTVWVR